MRAPAFKPLTVRLGGERWRVRSGKVTVDGCECWGVTDFGKREIVLDPSTQAEGNEREILIHEALHVLFPQVDESVVAAAAKELDDVLETMNL